MFPNRQALLYLIHLDAAIGKFAELMDKLDSLDMTCSLTREEDAIRSGTLKALGNATSPDSCGCFLALKLASNWEDMSTTDSWARQYDLYLDVEDIVSGSCRLRLEQDQLLAALAKKPARQKRLDLTVRSIVTGACGLADGNGGGDEHDDSGDNGGGDPGSADDDNERETCVAQDLQAAQQCHREPGRLVDDFQREYALQALQEAHMQMLGEVPLRVEKPGVGIDKSTNEVTLEWRRPKDKVIRDSVGNGDPLRNFPITDYCVLIWICNEEGSPQFREHEQVDLVFRHIAVLDPTAMVLTSVDIAGRSAFQSAGFHGLTEHDYILEVD